MPPQSFLYTRTHSGTTLLSFSQKLLFSRNRDFQKIMFFHLLVYILINLFLQICSYGPQEDIRFSSKKSADCVKRYQKNPRGGFSTFQDLFVNDKFHHVKTGDKGFYFLDICFYFLDIDTLIFWKQPYWYYWYQEIIAHSMFIFQGDG